MAAILALSGIGMMVGLSGAGSVIGIVISGSAVIGMVKKRPEKFANGIILCSLPATHGLYGFVAFIMYNDSMREAISMFQASVVFGAGFAVGLVTLIAGIYQGRVIAAGLAALGSGHEVFGSTFILAAFPEFYAILALVAAILMKNLMI
ncbi:MAG: ATPase [Spirochaetia bacterium]|nr:ATPase [Spirochaetia bacterium]